MTGVCGGRPDWPGTAMPTINWPRGPITGAGMALKAGPAYVALAGLKIQRVESKRVDEFANMSDEELRQYVYGKKELDG